MSLSKGFLIGSALGGAGVFVAVAIASFVVGDVNTLGGLAIATAVMVLLVVPVFVVVFGRRR